MSIKISEVFESIQGEGKFSGHPSVFVRVFGCNLHCRGFGMPAGKLSNEVDNVYANINKYKNYFDLPVVSTGCDSYPSSDPHFKDFSPKLSYKELIERIRESCNITDYNFEGIDLVITGGEPLIKGTQRKLAEFFTEYAAIINTFDTLTFETNGTQLLTDAMTNVLVNVITIPVVFSCSPKLSCSGERREAALIPAAIESYKQLVNTIKSDRPNSEVYLKFVVSNEEDVKEVIDTCKTLNFSRSDGTIYCMPEGSHVKNHERNASIVAGLCLKYKFVLCYRVHVAVFGNEWAK